MFTKDLKCIILNFSLGYCCFMGNVWGGLQREPNSFADLIMSSAMVEESQGIEPSTLLHRAGCGDHI